MVMALISVFVYYICMYNCICMLVMLYICTCVYMYCKVSFSSFVLYRQGYTGHKDFDQPLYTIQYDYDTLISKGEIYKPSKHVTCGPHVGHMWYFDMATTNGPHVALPISATLAHMWHTNTTCDVAHVWYWCGIGVAHMWTLK